MADPVKLVRRQVRDVDVEEHSSREHPQLPNDLRGHLGRCLLARLERDGFQRDRRRAARALTRGTDL